MINQNYLSYLVQYQMIVKYKASQYGKQKKSVCFFYLIDAVSEQAFFFDIRCLRIYLREIKIAVYCKRIMTVWKPENETKFSDRLPCNPYMFLRELIFGSHVNEMNLSWRTCTNCTYSVEYVPVICRIRFRFAEKDAIDRHTFCFISSWFFFFFCNLFHRREGAYAPINYHNSRQKDAAAVKKKLFCHSNFKPILFIYIYTFIIIDTRV